MQRRRAELVHRRDQRRGRAYPRDLLDHDAARDRVAPGAAVLLGDVHRVETGSHQRVEHVERELGRLVDLGSARRDLVVGELAHGCPQHQVLLGESVRLEGGVRHGHAVDVRTSK